MILYLNKTIEYIFFCKGYAYLIGYGFSIIGCYFFVRLVVNSMWRQLGWKGHPVKDKIRPRAWESSIVGLLESFLFTSSCLIGFPHFIVFWLAFKVAGRWSRLGGFENNKEDEVRTNKEDKVRTTEAYNIYILGNGLSISFSVVGAKIIKWLLRDDWILSINVSVGLLLLVLIIYLVIRHYDKYYKKDVK